MTARLLHLCRLGLEGSVPDHSTFSLNRHGRIGESNAFRLVFEAALRRCMASEAAAATTDALDRIYGEIGMPTRLRVVNIPKTDLRRMAQDTLKNFNANPGDRPADYTGRQLALLEAAW